MSGETHSITPPAKMRAEIDLASGEPEGILSAEIEEGIRHPRNVTYLRLLWLERRFLLRGAVFGFVLSLVVAFLNPLTI